MNISVFGAAGTVGQALIPVLTEQGHTVRAMEHTAPVGGPVSGVVRGSITDPEAVSALVENAQIVMQLTKGGKGVKQAVETSTHGTINILDAVRSTPSVEQYLLTSSDAAAGIWFHQHDRPVSHLTEPMSYSGYYSLGKVLEETLVREYSRNGTIPYTVARLSWVRREDNILQHFTAGFNKEAPLSGMWSGHFSEDQKKRLMNGEQFIVLPCSEEGSPLARTFVHRDDAVSGIISMIGNSSALRQRFHVSGPGFSYDEPAHYLAEKTSLSVEKITCPFCYPFDIDISHTRERTGWNPEYSVIDMIDTALEWDRAQPQSLFRT